MLNINKYTKPSIEDIKEDLEGNDLEAKPLDVPTPTAEELAAKYEVEISVVEEQLTKGIEVEKEHTTDLNVASEIARDHLNEDLYYYEKLAKVEGEDNA